MALEPVSNVILAKRYAEDRTADTWTRVLADACRGLAITVTQGTSDGAKALRRHTERDHGAHHSPDLFHLQHGVVQATGLTLARAAAHAEDRRTAAEARWKDACAAERAHRQRAHGPGCPPDFAARIRAAADTLAEASIA